MRTTMMSLVVSGSILGLAHGGDETKFKPTDTPKIKLSMKIAKADEFEGSTKLKLPKEKQINHVDAKTGKKTTLETIYVDAKTAITNKDIASTNVTKDPEVPKNWGIEVELTAEGKKKLSELSKVNVGNYLVIFFGEELQMSPLIRDPINEGKALLTGKYTEEEATKVAKSLVGRE
jgi:preprotein translocase subunit SecD